MGYYSAAEHWSVLCFFFLYLQLVFCSLKPNCNHSVLFMGMVVWPNSQGQNLAVERIMLFYRVHACSHVVVSVF